MSDKGVCRTALATPGVLIIYALSAHTCLAPFYLATEKRQKRPQVQNTISTFFSISCVAHLALSVPIPLSGV